MNTNQMPISQLFVLNEIAPMTSGGSLQLAKGQIGLFDQTQRTQNGASAVNGYGSATNRRKFLLKVGSGIKGNDGNLTSKPMSSVVFGKEDVLDVTFDRAKEPKYDEVILGYDGFDSNKTIGLKQGEATTVAITLEGEVMAYLGYHDGSHTFQYALYGEHPDECEDCPTPCTPTSCKTVISELAEEIRNTQVRVGKKLGEIVEVHTIFDCTSEVTPSSTQTYYTLELCDLGDAQALALVQAQYPANDVARIERRGSTSTYQLRAASSPAAYQPRTSSDYLFDCDCPTGYTETGGGYVYIFNVNDAGSDISSGIDSALNSTADVTFLGRQGDEGKYLVVLASNELSATDISGMESAYDAFQYEYEGQRDSVCVPDSQPSTVAWTAGETCDVAEKTYYLDLSDTECGDSRLTEVQEAYPDLTITEASDPAPANCRRRYLAVVESVEPVCDGCSKPEHEFEAPEDFEFVEWQEYTAEGALTAFTSTGGGTTLSFTFTGGATDIGEANNTYTGVASTSSGSGTGATFTVTRDAAGAVDTVVVVEPGTGYADGDTITIADADIGSAGADITITVATQTSAETYTGVASTTSGSGTGATFDVTRTTGGAIASITITNAGSGYAVGDTITIANENIVADDEVNASDITLTITAVGGEYPTDCKCGIKLVAKPQALCTSKEMSDRIANIPAGHVKIQISGGEAPSNLRVGYKYVTRPFDVTRTGHGRHFGGDNWGINFWEREKMTFDYQLGVSSPHDYSERILFGTESLLEPCGQYDVYTVSIKTDRYEGGNGARGNKTLRYQFVVPQASDDLFQDFFNELAGGNLSAPQV